MMVVTSPNLSVRPVTAEVNPQGHLCVGGADVVELAERFGTPLWIMDEQTILDAIASYKKGLEKYPDYRILYAGKAFLCLAICKLIQKQGLGIDVVSSGELYTAVQADFEPELIYFHGNNKSDLELREALDYGNVRIVIDSESELLTLAKIALHKKTKARILLRVIPGVEPDTHHHIVTGHHDSKFGLALESLIPVVQRIVELKDHVELVGLHTHIGSQAQESEPYLDLVDVLADCYSDLYKSFGMTLPELDVGGGLAIAYTSADTPDEITQWASAVSSRVASAFKERNLQLPKLLVEPGRSIVGTAGVTIYRAGHKKRLPSGKTYLAVDGGMADNPRPITYDAKYSAAIANRMDAPIPERALTLVGKYCESGDIIVKESYLSAESGDLIAVFGTGAYNYSMASNYNRTGRPACVLVSNGEAEVIIERETNDDLLRKDRVPDRLR